MTEAAAETKRFEGHAIVEGARKEMRAVIGDLKSIRYRLLGVHGSIPPSPQETSKGDLEGDPDVETEIRTVIANGIRNSLDPFIDDLETAVGGLLALPEALRIPCAQQPNAQVRLRVFWGDGVKLEVRPWAEVE